MRYLSETSWRHSWDFDTQFPNNYEFLYVSVCWLATSLVKLDKYGVISTYRWDIFSKFFGDTPGMLALIQNSEISVFLADPPLVGSALDLHLSVCVCVCVCVVSWLNCLISLVLDEISFWNLLETFLGCFYTSFQ